MKRLNYNMNYSTKIVGLATGYLKDMEIKPDYFRSYTDCKHFPTAQLFLEHLLSWPVLTAAQLKIDITPPKRLFYTLKLWMWKGNTLYLWSCLICCPFLWIRQLQQLCATIRNFTRSCSMADCGLCVRQLSPRSSMLSLRLDRNLIASR